MYVIAMAEGFLKPKAGFSTFAVHAGQDPAKWKSSAVVPPIVTSTTFKQTMPGEHGGYAHGRSGNPSRNTLEECLAALEGAKHALAFASGVGTVTTLVSLLRSGDHVVSSDELYGGTTVLFREVFDKMAIDVTFTDLTNIENLKKAINRNTKMIWLETPANPCLKVLDIAAVTKLSKTKGDIIVVVDNTFSTPYLQRPLDFGADIVMYSLTKYMNGHTDVIMGAAVLNNDEIEKKLRFLQCAMGVVPSPFDCYLVNRGLKTLALRIDRQKTSSLAVAKWLENHPKVVQVLHPGLPSHPQHDIAKKQTSGHTGVFSFKHCGGFEESRKLITSFKLIMEAASLGGFETIVLMPTLVSHKDVPAEQRAALGITDSLIRVSIGLEDVEDLIADLDQAIGKAF